MTETANEAVVNQQVQFRVDPNTGSKIGGYKLQDSHPFGILKGLYRVLFLV